MTTHTVCARASLIAAMLVAALGLSQQASAAAPQAPSSQPVPQPKILVIDRKAILERSAVGQSIAQQAQSYWQQAQVQLKNEASAIKSQGQQLQQQLAILAADVKAKKVRDFEAQQGAFQQKVQ